VESFLNSDGWERRRIMKHLDGNGLFFEPVLGEALTFFKDSHLFLMQRRKSGNPLTLMELLIIGHDLEFIARPGLLRIYWAAINSDTHRKDYSDAMLSSWFKKGCKTPRKNTRNISKATDELEKWVNGAPSALLTRSEIKCLKTFVDSVRRKKGDPISAKELRNWIAHRDFMLVNNVVIFNLSNGLKKRKSFNQKQIEIMMEVTQKLCDIVLFSNMIFYWCASYLLKGIDLAEIASQANLSYIPP
jgi:hypothetical protein